MLVAETVHFLSIFVFWQNQTLDCQFTCSFVIHQFCPLVVLLFYFSTCVSFWFLYYRISWFLVSWVWTSLSVKLKNSHRGIRYMNLFFFQPLFFQSSVINLCLCTQLGANGYTFAIDPNGYVLLHPNLQPKVCHKFCSKCSYSLVFFLPSIFNDVHLLSHNNYLFPNGFV